MKPQSEGLIQGGKMLPKKCSLPILSLYLSSSITPCLPHTNRNRWKSAKFVACQNIIPSDLWKKMNHELQSCLWRNLFPCSVFTISQAVMRQEGASFTRLHGRDSQVPSFQNIIGTQNEIKQFTIRRILSSGFSENKLHKMTQRCTMMLKKLKFSQTSKKISGNNGIQIYPNQCSKWLATLNADMHTPCIKRKNV